MKPLRHHGGTQRRAEVAEIRQPRVSGAGAGALPGIISDLKGWDPGHTPGAHTKAYESEFMVCSPAPPRRVPSATHGAVVGVLRSWGVGSHSREKLASLDSGGVFPSPGQPPLSWPGWLPAPTLASLLTLPGASRPLHRWHCVQHGLDK